MTILDKNYWSDRYISGKTGWDIGFASNAISQYLDQIKNKETITITDPKMTRFFMSLDEAVELVLFAFEHGNQGDLFVNKAPAGNIGDLAQALKELCKTENEVKE
jgi:UDP-glucose 4-epimerase